MKNRLLSLLICLGVALCVSAAAPKYIFYFIGDGMGMGHIMSTQTYNREVLKNEKPLLMMQFPVASMAMTYSYKNPITDSAAAGTALATGHKTRNGMLGQNQDTVSVTSIARLLKDKGYGVAITTTVPPDDATPAAFYAHQPSRKMFYEIGMDMAASGYDFFAGSELRGTKDASGAENNLISTLNSKGYSIAYGLENIPSGKDKILLLNPKEIKLSHAGFTIDSIKGALNLPGITTAALNHLQRVSPKAFFMMVEGGNIDWAAHSNDGGTVIKEIMNFNQAIDVAYQFYLKHPKETLIIITADHDTGGMSIGVNKGPKVANMAFIDFQRASKEAFGNICSARLKSGQTYTWDEMKALLNKYFGLYGAVKVTEKQDEELKEDFEKVFEKHDTDEIKTLYASFNSFTQEVFEVLDRNAGFGWTSNNHTGNPVPVFAIGNGAQEFSRISNNIDIPARISKLVGVRLSE